MSTRLTIDGIEVEWRRNSRRRTRVGMAFDPSGFVIMDAPPNTNEDEIRTLVAEHYRWLRVRLDKVKESSVEVRALRYETGELIHYLGDAYRLDVVGGRTAQVELQMPADGQLPLLERTAFGELTVTSPDVSVEAVKGLLNEWMQAQADVVFVDRIAHWHELPWLGERLPVLRHMFMRSQWGSCSVDGKISLNTHLIKAPVTLVDYVILHELCHLRHHNHGKRFYALMSRHMPNWQRRRTQLDRFLPVLLQD
ncbi:MAG: SprT family zinc-dependent metalloprotease [Gammaproteobacteria bacterium]|nr:SprT family zinc-dependent metalloprotease [Gammaproteobacteria bacterium]